MKYYSINNITTSEYVVKRSKFITTLIPLNQDIRVENLITQIKHRYNDATHNCYAYILNDQNYKFSDDGEPAGTAGLPIFSVLKKRQLEYILTVVTRYFGGIKLGTEGLVSAYTHALTECLDKATIKEYKLQTIAFIKFQYYHTKTIEFILKQFQASLLKSEYSDLVTYTISCDIEIYNTMKNILFENTNKEIEIIFDSEKFL